MSAVDKLSKMFKNIESTYISSINQNKIDMSYMESLSAISDILHDMIKCDDIDGICKICNEYDELVSRINLLRITPSNTIDVKSFLLGSIATIKMVAGHIAEDK